MQNVKQLKRGEILFKEGENTDTVYFIQSGRVVLYLERNGKKVEISLESAKALGLIEE